MEELRPGLLVGMGNPLLDISATVKDDILAKYGLHSNDAILAKDVHKPLYEELVQKYRVDYIAGGSVQNTLRACQWVFQMPRVAVFFGCVGTDNYAKILKEKATSDGVHVVYQCTSNEPTGTCAVLINGLHRSLVANLAAANNFTINHLKQPKNWKLVQNANYFYISGYFLTVSPLSIMEIAHYAHTHNRTFIMNLSAIFVPKLYITALMEAMPYVDLLFGNAMEAEELAAVQGWNTRDLREIGKRMVALPKKNMCRPRMVVLTQSHLPVLVVQKNLDVLEFDVPGIPTDEIVDTNGAGDAFAAGYLTQYMKHRPIDVCVRCGNWLAGHVIRRNGCSFEGEPDFYE